MNQLLACRQHPVPLPEGHSPEPCPFEDAAQHFWDEPSCLADSRSREKTLQSLVWAAYLEQQVPLWKQLPVDLQMCPSVPSCGSGLIPHAVTTTRTCGCKQDGKKSVQKGQTGSFSLLLLLFLLPSAAAAWLHRASWCTCSQLRGRRWVSSRISSSLLSPIPGKPPRQPQDSLP